jgi:hypothetical protein
VVIIAVPVWHAPETKMLTRAPPSRWNETET